MWEWQFKGDVSCSNGAAAAATPSADWEPFVFRSTEKRLEILRAVKNPSNRTPLEPIRDVNIVNGHEYVFDPVTMTCFSQSAHGGIGAACASTSGSRSHEVDFRIVPPDSIETRRRWWCKYFGPDSDVAAQLDQGKSVIRIETSSLKPTCKNHLIGHADCSSVIISVDYDKNMFWVLEADGSRRRGSYKLWKKKCEGQSYLSKDIGQQYMCHLTPKAQLESKMHTKIYSKYMNCPTTWEEQGVRGNLSSAIARGT